jgi:hypothetical protein
MHAKVFRVCVFGLLGMCSQAQAGGFWARFHADFHRNNCWPQPFQATDRELTRAPIVAMTSAGWRLHNTLSDHFFNAEDQGINQAGEIKLRWIVTQAPTNRRTVFVLRGSSPEATAGRVATVQRAIDRLVVDGPRPEVLITDIVPPGASGDYFDQVQRQLQQSIPAPRLPEMESTSGDM